MSVLIPTEELTLTDKKGFRAAAVEAGINRAIAKAIGAREELVYRQWQNIADAITAAEAWATAALAAVGVNYTVFQAIAAPILANNKVAVFYGVGVATVPNPVSRLAFRVGAAAGTTKAVFDLELLDTVLIPEGYFSEPIIYDPQQVLNIVAMARIATGLAARVILKGYIIEPLQQTIS